MEGCPHFLTPPTPATPYRSDPPINALGLGASLEMCFIPSLRELTELFSTILQWSLETEVPEAPELSRTTKSPRRMRINLTGPHTQPAPHLADPPDCSPAFFLHPTLLGKGLHTKGASSFKDPLIRTVCSGSPRAHS